ncbi:hypothetical protein L6R52_20340 [Myxococcota bacterium]|nr:hypothetical protein [Myxococcota bacterium]
MSLVVAGALATSALAACTIIVQPGGPSPTPVPLPVPLTCVESGSQASAHVLFDVRVERTTVNLAQRYQALMEQTVMALATARIMTTLAAIVRLDERPIEPAVLAAWGCSLDDPRTLTPEQVLSYWATAPSPPPSPIGCALDPLVGVGEDLGAVVTQYPPELPGTSGRRVFGSAPDLVLVVHIDGEPRRAGFDDAACSKTRAVLGADGAARWLGYADGAPPMDRVVHWFITSDELVDRETFVERCRAYEGFPSDVLDLVDPSPKALYGPLAGALDRAGAGRVAALPLCALFTDGSLAVFLKQEIEALAELAGTSIDETAFASVLGGGGIPIPGDATAPGP